MYAPTTTRIASRRLDRLPRQPPAKACGAGQGAGAERADEGGEGSPLPLPGGEGKGNQLGRRQAGAEPGPARKRRAGSSVGAGVPDRLMRRRAQWGLGQDPASAPRWRRYGAGASSSAAGSARARSSPSSSVPLRPSRCTGVPRAGTSWARRDAGGEFGLPDHLAGRLVRTPRKAGLPPLSGATMESEPSARKTRVFVTRADTRPGWPSRGRSDGRARDDRAVTSPFGVIHRCFAGVEVDGGQAGRRAAS